MFRVSSTHLQEDIVVHKQHMVPSLPRSRVLLEKITFSQLVKKFHAINGTQSFGFH